jgi:hypothetical protein
MQSGKAGTRPPMLTGYLLLAVSGLLLAMGGFTGNYWLVLPGLLLYGGGLAVVLTVNDPVSLSDVPDAAQGQAAGVSATAEQFGGAFGIAAFYLAFHTTYVAQLHAVIDRGSRTGTSPIRATPCGHHRRREHRAKTQTLRPAAWPLPRCCLHRLRVGICRRVSRCSPSRCCGLHPCRKKRASCHIVSSRRR